MEDSTGCVSTGYVSAGCVSTGCVSGTEEVLSGAVETLRVAELVG